MSLLDSVAKFEYLIASIPNIISNVTLLADVRKEITAGKGEEVKANIDGIENNVPKAVNPAKIKEKTPKAFAPLLYK